MAEAAAVAAACIRRRRCRQDFRLRRRPTQQECNSVPLIAIIVPFREQLEQDRTSQLRKFELHMANFLRGGRFVIIVVTQSNDDRKFNRGQLLNVGTFGIRNLYVLESGLRLLDCCTQDSLKPSDYLLKGWHPSSSMTWISYLRLAFSATTVLRQSL